jgi:hypothetical protein
VVTCMHDKCIDVMQNTTAHSENLAGRSSKIDSERILQFFLLKQINLYFGSER